MALICLHFLKMIKGYQYGYQMKALDIGLRICCPLIDFGVCLRGTGRSGPLYFWVFFKHSTVMYSFHFFASF